MDILKNGTDVRILDAVKSGKISCAHIRSENNVTYDVIFWMNDARKCEEFAPYEFKVLDNPIQKTAIGFCNGEVVKDV